MHAVALIAGAAVMVVEILGTRVLSPVFGVSLFIWSALLAVALCSLALGYALGGIVADRRPSARLLGGIVSAAGIALALVPMIRHGVLSATEGAGLRVGPLVAATILFGPCLTLLGGVGPIAVRLVTEHLGAAGRSVGSVYAVSTLGSFAATLLTPYVLVPAFDTTHVMLGTSVLLVFTGAVLSAWRWRIVLAGALLLRLALGSGEVAALPPAYRVVEQLRSAYGLVQVIDDDTRQIRFLRADRSILGGRFMSDHAAIFSFFHVLEALQFMRPQAQTMLAIGLGTGFLPNALEPLGIKTDVVEIDPAVVASAKRHFGFVPTGSILIEDGRTFLRRTERTYDLILHDTFSGGGVAEHLYSHEVFQRIKSVLRPGGILSLVFPGFAYGPRAAAPEALWRTLRASFAHVQAYPDAPLEPEEEAARNLIFFASDQPLSFSIPASATFENDSCEATMRAFTHWSVLTHVPPGPIITDERNPLSRLQLVMAEGHFAAMREIFPLAVWLHEAKSASPSR